MFYVAGWEIIYFNFIPDFADRYGAHVLDQLRLVNVAMTFIEPLPVGILMTLVSAVALRRPSRPPA